jgi:hypothetical protein
MSADSWNGMQNASILGDSLTAGAVRELASVNDLRRSSHDLERDRQNGPGGVDDPANGRLAKPSVCEDRAGSAIESILGGIVRMRKWIREPERQFLESGCREERTFRSAFFRTERRRRRSRKRRARDRKRRARNRDGRARAGACVPRRALLTAREQERSGGAKHRDCGPSCAGTRPGSARYHRGKA